MLTLSPRINDYGRLSLLADVVVEADSACAKEILCTGLGGGRIVIAGES